mmetsp:Transcript_9405/g.21215  ORF Transcript_9405/g.21215 Transcript_9405/m.21215 type:complete len:214 (-) Transcript_9405:1844-2485(-)
MALSGVVADSYSSSGALQRARSGSVLFMEQYQREGSLRASTTPRRRLHFLQRSHSTQVALLAPAVWPNIELSSSSPPIMTSSSSSSAPPMDESSTPSFSSQSSSSFPDPDMGVSAPLLLLAPDSGAVSPVPVPPIVASPPTATGEDDDDLPLFFFLRRFPILRPSTAKISSSSSPAPPPPPPSPNTRGDKLLDRFPFMELVVRPPRDPPPRSM